MRRDEDIEMFLASPNTLELDPDAILKPTRSIPKKKRKQRLPPYIPFKTVYEETDMSKLTERQKIMAMKFRTAEKNLNPLFLAANDIYRHNKTKRCPVECENEINEAIEFVEWLSSKIPANLQKRLRKIKKDFENISHIQAECSDESEKIFKRLYHVISLIKQDQFSC